VHRQTKKQEKAPERTNKAETPDNPKKEASGEEREREKRKEEKKNLDPLE
jgi:hypothetical protein